MVVPIHKWFHFVQISKKSVSLKRQTTATWAVVIVLSGKRDSSPLRGPACGRRGINVTPSPLARRSPRGTGVASFGPLPSKQKGSHKDCLSTLERKTRLEPACAGRPAAVAKSTLPPGRLRGGPLGGLGSLVRVYPTKQKRQPQGLAFCFERKTRLELATPTLARSCSTN